MIGSWEPSREQFILLTCNLSQTICISYKQLHHSIFYKNIGSSVPEEGQCFFNNEQFIINNLHQLETIFK